MIRFSLKSIANLLLTSVVRDQDINESSWSALTCVCTLALNVTQPFQHWLRSRGGLAGCRCPGRALRGNLTVTASPELDWNFCCQSSAFVSIVNHPQIEGGTEEEFKWNCMFSVFVVVACCTSFVCTNTGDDKGELARFSVMPCSESSCMCLKVVTGGLVDWQAQNITTSPTFVSCLSVVLRQYWV